MNTTQNKIKISASIIVLAVSLLCFEALAYITNLNQPAVSIQLAFVLYFIVLLHITLLYDLHYRRKDAWSKARQSHAGIEKKLVRGLKILSSALWNRIEHLRRWSYLRHWQNYLILPAVLFWTTVSLMYLNMGRVRVQQLLIILSFIGFSFVYTHLTRIFSLKEQKVGEKIFIIFSAVKLYAVFLSFSAMIGITRYYCLPSYLLVLGAFAVSSLLIYQALFQDNLISLKGLSLMLAISLALGYFANLVNLSWGENYFTAGVLLMAVYNFLWGLLHSYLEKTLTASKFVELLIASLAVAAIAVGTTNFNARLLDACY